MSTASLASTGKRTSLVERVTFYNKDSGFGVLRKGVEPARLITVVGHAAPIGAE
jgi:hypothetical protein